MRNEITPDIGCDEGNFVTGTDLIRPRITHEPLGTTESPAPRTLQAYIADNVGISTGANAPRVYHKLNSDTTWVLVNPTSVQDSLYTFTIPGYPLGSVVNYYLAAQDDGGNNVTHPYNGSGSNPPGTIPPPVTHTYFIATLLTGVQTIGATGSNYTSIDQAITAVNSIGVGNGGVTFLIRAGTYDENSSSINCYLDANRPVVFRADSGANVVINKTAANGVTAAFRFRGASNVTIDGSWPGDPDGRHITINNASGNTSIIHFSDSTDHNTVKNCVLNFGPTTSSTNRVVQVGNTGTQPELPIVANRIENNDIIGGYYCIYAYGNTTELVDSTYIVKNDIRDFYYYGLYTGYANGMTIAYNHIYHVTASASSTIYGMYLTTGSNNHWIHGNRIDQLQGSATGTQYGMYPYGTGHLISSNMIAIGGGNTGTCYGMYKTLANGNLRIEFNTINIFGTTTGSSSYCLYNSSSSGSDSLWGNIFQNTRTGGTTTIYHVGLYIGNVATFAFSDYNLFWTGEDPADNRWAARLSTTNLNTAADLMANTTWTPRDQFSFGEMPPFVSDTNLHVRGDMSTAIESGAPANGSVLFDVDGDARIPTGMYDIGADEGTFRRVAFGTIAGVVYDSIPARPGMAGVTVSAGRYSTVT
ncbi:MAG: hypothetical protein OEM52_15050, partial [bacterium]|nr:hypothetical protein [bacterium]